MAQNAIIMVADSEIGTTRITGHVDTILLNHTLYGFPLFPIIIGCTQLRERLTAQAMTFLTACSSTVHCAQGLLR